MIAKRWLSKLLGVVGALWSTIVAASSPVSGDLDIVWKADFSRDPPALLSVKLLDWNIERGVNLQGIIRLIEREKPDICFLQEVDFNTRRSGYKNVAVELARRFQFNYVLGVEFQELGQSSGSIPAYQGQAILSRWPIQSPRILRFRHQTKFWKPRWYLPNWSIFQRRLGGRMAMAAEIELNGIKVVAYDIHLESRMPENGQLKQLGEVFADIARYPRDAPILIAGDFNTRSVLELKRRMTLAGFHDAIGSTQATTPSRDPMHGVIFNTLIQPFRRQKTRCDHLVLDWIFARGTLSSDNGRVHQDVVASDHYPLTVRLSFAARQD